LTLSLISLSVLQSTDVPVIDPRLLTHVFFAQVENQSEGPAAQAEELTEHAPEKSDQPSE